MASWKEFGWEQKKFNRTGRLKLIGFMDSRQVVCVGFVFLSDAVQGRLDELFQWNLGYDEHVGLFMIFMKQLPPPMSGMNRPSQTSMCVMPFLAWHVERLGAILILKLNITLLFVMMTFLFGF